MFVHRNNHPTLSLGPNHHDYFTPGDCTYMHAVKKGMRLENKKNLELKSGWYRDGIKRKTQDRDGAWVTAHNGITQCAMPTSWWCNPYIVGISGIEAAVHTVRSVFEYHESEAVLLVDASNAFNSLNRPMALHNIRRIYPLLSTVLINTYMLSSLLMVTHSFPRSVLPRVILLQCPCMPWQQYQR